MHKQNCVGGQHKHVRCVSSPYQAETANLLLCKNNFKEHHDRLDIYKVMKHPESVLSLLLVSKEIFQEAMPLFYRYNTFQFNNFKALSGFFRSTSISRRQHLTSLAFGNMGYGVCSLEDDFFEELNYSNLQCLRVVAPTMDRSGRPYYSDENSDRSITALQASWLMRMLIKHVRGLREFHLVGYDFLYDNGKWNRIDVNDSRSGAEYIRKYVMAPKVTDSEEDW